MRNVILVLLGTIIFANPVIGKTIRLAHALPATHTIAQASEKFKKFLSLKRETLANVDATVISIIEQVRRDGDGALIELTKKFGKFTALQDVSLALAQGEILAILGPSGSGKTTLLRVIAGFERVEHGKIKMFGNTVLDESIFVNPEQRDVGMVFQEYALFPHLTVEENIKFGILNLNKSDMESRYDKVLNLVRLQGLGTRYPHELSGGQQQRVALARTIAPGPNAVLLDEPFSNLDPSDFRVFRNPSGDCSVLSRDFHGGVMFITVILPSGIRLRCVEYSQSGLVSGDRVSVIPAREAPFLGFSRD